MPLMKLVLREKWIMLHPCKIHPWQMCMMNKHLLSIVSFLNNKGYLKLPDNLHFKKPIFSCCSIEMARAANSPVFGQSAKGFETVRLTTFLAVTSFRAATVCSPIRRNFCKVSKSNNEIVCCCSFSFTVLLIFRFTCFHANQ